MSFETSNKEIEDPLKRELQRFALITANRTVPPPSRMDDDCVVTLAKPKSRVL